MNLVEAELAERDGGLVARFGPHELGVPPRSLAARPALRGYAGRAGRARHPSRGHRGRARRRTTRGLDVTVDIREDMGSEVFLHFSLDAPRREGRGAPRARRRRGGRGGRRADAPPRQPVHRQASPAARRRARASRSRLAVDTRAAPLLRPRDRRADRFGRCAAGTTFRGARPAGCLTGDVVTTCPPRSVPRRRKMGTHTDPIAGRLPYRRLRTHESNG